MAQAPQKPATVEDARAFLADAEEKLLALSTNASRASWVQSTFITDDTEILSAQANEKLIAATAAYAKQAARFSGLALPPDVARKLDLLKNALTLAAPADPKEREELTRIAAALEGAYGKGKYCPKGSDKCLDLEDITKIMAESRDPEAAATTSGRAGTPSRRRSRSRSSATWSSPTRARGSSASRTRARCGARSTTCRPPTSPASSTGSGSRCVRSTCRSTPTCAGSCGRSTATPCRPPAPSRRTCSATSGRRTGATSIRSWRRRARIGAST